MARPNICQFPTYITMARRLWHFSCWTTFNASLMPGSFLWLNGRLTKSAGSALKEIPRQMQGERPWKILSMPVITLRITWSRRHGNFKREKHLSSVSPISAMTRLADHWTVVYRSKCASLRCMAQQTFLARSSKTSRP